MKLSDEDVNRISIELMTAHKGCGAPFWRQMVRMVAEKLPEAQPPAGALVTAEELAEIMRLDDAIGDGESESALDASGALGHLGPHLLPKLAAEVRRLTELYWEARGVERVAQSGRDKAIAERDEIYRELEDVREKRTAAVNLSVDLAGELGTLREKAKALLRILDRGCAGGEQHVMIAALHAAANDLRSEVETP